MKSTNALGFTMAVLVGLAALAPQTGAPAVRYVTNLLDSGPDSLRHAIEQSANGDVIDFATNGTIRLTSGPLTVGKSLTIRGPGASWLTVSGNDRSRVFLVSNLLATVTISGLTIADGLLRNGNLMGGGIFNSGVLFLNDCVITGNRVVGPDGGPGQSNVETVGGPGGVGGPARGGGIYSSGVLVIRNCAIVRNMALGGTGGMGGFGLGGGGKGGNGGPVYGGGIFWNCGPGPNYCFNSTISDNFAGAGAGGLGGGGDDAAGGDGGAGGDARGGGVYADCPSFQVWFWNCTISHNEVVPGSSTAGGSGHPQGSAGRAGTAAAGGLQIFPSGTTTPIVAMVNTIVAQNAQNQAPIVIALDVEGKVGSFGHNLIGQSDHSSGWTTSDLTRRAPYSLDPGLGPLADNGGQTLTHALLLSSPARDAGDDSVLDEVRTDQRGFPRKYGSHVDIGAFEYQPSRRWIVGLDSAEFRSALAQAHDGDSLVYSRGPFPGTMSLTDGELIVDKSVDIIGPGAALLTVSAFGSGRVFHITSNATVRLSGLTLADGYSSTNGGALWNDGALTVSECVFAGNKTEAAGGAIWNAGQLNVQSSTFFANDAADHGGAIGDGGLKLSVFNSTFVSNSAATWGGAISTPSGFGEVMVGSCTFTGNSASDGGGIFTCLEWFRGSPCERIPTIGNCIIAGNNSTYGPDLFGAVTSAGYNLVGKADDYAQGFGAVGDQVGRFEIPIDAMLGPLQDNGGPTPTMALLPGSPAIDNGSSDSAATDQRGGRRALHVAEPRVRGSDGSDIGAYERDGLLRITQIPSDQQSVQLRFTSELGSFYRVDYKADLAPGAWATLSDNVPGTGGDVAVIDADPLVSQRFYRVQLLR
jgi:hypothetical protein